MSMGFPIDILRSVWRAHSRFAQKLLIDGLFVPHFEQRIDVSTRVRRPIAFLSPDTSDAPQAHGRG